MVHSEYRVALWCDPRPNFRSLRPAEKRFQKLGIDLRRPQQDMLLEAIRDFVAKHEAERAFR